MIDHSAHRAHAWLIGYSAARAGKPDDTQRRYPGDHTEAGHLRDSYLAGRLFGARSLTVDLVQSA